MDNLDEFCEWDLLTHTKCCVCAHIIHTIHTHTYIHTPHIARTHTYTHIHTTHTYTHIHTHTHTYTHTHTHTHTHTYRSGGSVCNREGQNCILGNVVAAREKREEKEKKK